MIAVVEGMCVWGGGICAPYNSAYSRIFSTFFWKWGAPNTLAHIRHTQHFQHIFSSIVLQAKNLWEYQILAKNLCFWEFTKFSLFFSRLYLHITFLCRHPEMMYIFYHEILDNFGYSKFLPVLSTSCYSESGAIN